MAYSKNPEYGSAGSRWSDRSASTKARAVQLATGFAIEGHRSLRPVLRIILISRRALRGVKFYTECIVAASSPVNPIRWKPAKRSPWHPGSRYGL